MVSVLVSMMLPVILVNRSLSVVLRWYISSWNGFDFDLFPLSLSLLSRCQVDAVVTTIKVYV